MTGDPGGSPDPLWVACGPIFRKNAGHGSCRMSALDMQYKEKRIFYAVVLLCVLPLFGRVSGCVPSCGEGQHPCPSRRFRASLGPLFRQCRDCLFPPPWTLSEGRKEQLDKDLGSHLQLSSGTSARSAGSTKGFRNYRKWGQKQGEKEILRSLSRNAYAHKKKIGGTPGVIRFSPPLWPL